MATTIDLSKEVSYAVLESDGEDLSKTVSYAVLESTAIDVSKLVSYVVLDSNIHLSAAIGVQSSIGVELQSVQPILYVNVHCTSSVSAPLAVGMDVVLYGDISIQSSLSPALSQDYILSGGISTTSDIVNSYILALYVLSFTIDVKSSITVAVVPPLSERVLSDVDPLWVALEIDLVQNVGAAPYTLRHGNRGSIQRTVSGTLYQYSDRLITPIDIGTRISISGDTATPFYQQPLHGVPNGGTISWVVDPTTTEWFGPSGSVYVGRTFRLYTGFTTQDLVADVDLDLDLVYTGHIANYSFDLVSGTMSVQTTDASSDLDKSLVDDLYPSDFPIELLQGKPKPQLWGRRFSIEPVLEDQTSLTYRVTRIEVGVVELDDVTQLTVGGVPWRLVTSLFTVDLSPTLANLLTQYAALPGALQADYDSVVGSDPANFNNSNGLQNKVNLVGLLTLYNNLTAPQQADYLATIAADTAFYNNTPAGILNKMGLIKVRYFGLQQGEWMVDLPNGTVQLGSDPLGADVRVDAQAVGWDTLTTAGLLTDICTAKGIPIDTSSMAQLDLDWNGIVGFYTGTENVNCLSVLDQITASQLCWWSLNVNGEVQAGTFDAPSIVPDYIFVGSQPNVPLDFNLLVQALDPVPKGIASLSQQGIVPPAYRVRIGYAPRQSPQSSFLPGATQEEQADAKIAELVADWSAGLASSGFYELSPSDGTAIRSSNPRAQDVYISSISNEYSDAIALRTRLVQRVIGTIEHNLWSASVWMPPADVRLMSSVLILWIDENDRTRALYGGSFRVTSAMMSLGGGPQQLELWGVSGLGSGSRYSSTDAPPVTSLIVPVSIGVVTYTVLSDAIIGNVVASLFVTTSNGSAFVGVLSFGPPYNNDSSTIYIGGNSSVGYTVALLRDLSVIDVGTHNVTVTATQGGTTISQDFSFEVTVT